VIAKPSVLVTESNARAAVAIIRSLLGHGIEVTAAADHRCCAGFFVGGLKRRILYPSLEANPNKFIDWLLNYLTKNPTEMLLPLGDAGVSLIAKHQDEIRKHTLLLLPDYNCFLTFHDKILANKAAERAGIPIPRCWYPDEVCLDSVFKSVTYPALIKPAFGVGARGIMRADSPYELELHWNRAIKTDSRMFIQELIPLTGRQYVVDILIDQQMRTIVAVASEKVRFYPIKRGASTLSKSIARLDICESAVKLMQSIGYYGIGNTDFIEDPRDKTAKFLEVNPRFGEMHAICSVAGIDLPYLLYRVTKGENVQPVCDYTEGKFLRFGPTDLMWFLRSRDRFNANPSFFKSFGKSVAGTLVAEKDYGPLIGYLLENIVMLANFKKFAYRFLR
jgi:predicted ATP-grasp superfamily ATP-dependent carboligase